MILFTKPGCGKCEQIKNGFDLASLGVREVSLTDDPAALAELAFHECVELAERELPILISDDKKVYSGAIPIKRHLCEISCGGIVTGGGE